MEKDELASGASGANAGIVNCPAPNTVSARFHQRSRQILLGLSEELETDIEFSISGGVYVTLEEEMLKVFQEEVKASESSKFPVELLDADEVQKLVPGISPRVIGGVYDPHNARVNPFKLAGGYMRAAKRQHAVLQENTCARAIKVKGSGVESVVTSTGEIKTRVVINAAGFNAWRIAGMVDVDIPIIPARGQILTTEVLPHILKHEIDVMSIANDVKPAANKGEGKGPHPFYIVPRPSGNLLIGATKEYGVAEKNVTLEAVSEIVAWFADVFPPLLECNIIRSWAGVRPMSPDDLPLIGKSTEIEGFFIASGHGGDGIMLSSATGEMICHLVTGNRMDQEFVQAFDPQRFKEREKIPLGSP